MFKALFFDIDGTLVSFATHRIPASTVEALREAKKRGVKIFISTGRPLNIITNLGQIEPLIDGYITTNGAYCFAGKETVSIHPMKRKDVETIIDDGYEQGYSMIIVGSKNFVVCNDTPAVHRIFVEELKVENIDFSLSYNDLADEEILQVTPFVTTEQETRLMPRLGNCTAGRWHPEFVDITAGGIDKARGLHEMAEYMGLRIEETMAFGDGGNDIPILKAAGTGVAMGNGLDEVKACADYTTTAVDGDGIRNALRHFRVI
ncbi:Cof-type HAD-IIB family hydrolase [Prevotella sp. KH2C16]|uniref:Cof-type HAD-IIB family hydrolase n=1 Tax=Prevotella sp. KH2C16 TaxID=1855325 RepID=UPI0008E77134|nr:Cof-type HAD-IIB family hydrolase [Prevotella sp. KH2C16]SFG65409.1 hypothetical protein SAMN05216383_12616 [Prevotella sp. KH2C16]